MRPGLWEARRESQQSGQRSRSTRKQQIPGGGASPVAEQEGAREGEDEDDDGEHQLELLVLVLVGEPVGATQSVNKCVHVFSVTFILAPGC